MIVTANIILHAVLVSGAALVYSFSGIPALSTGTQEFPKMKQHLCMDRWHSCPGLQLKETTQLHMTRDVALRRSGDSEGRVYYCRCSVWPKKTLLCGDPPPSPVRPPVCQPVLEAKIEIPDTSVVNVAHASAASEQEVL